MRKTFNRGNAAEPDTLDPHLASMSYENNIIGDMFLGLMTEDAAANAVPGAALGYSASPDGLVYTFKLRDHKWSDGVSVTAQDYRFLAAPHSRSEDREPIRLHSLSHRECAKRSMAASCRPTNSASARWTTRRCEISFNIQVPYIAQLFTHYATFAVPQHVVELHGDHWLDPENIVTNGAYVLKEWVPNDHILLVKNPHFYDAAEREDRQSLLLSDAGFFRRPQAFPRRRTRHPERRAVAGDRLGASNLPGALHVSPYILIAICAVQLRLSRPSNDIPRAHRPFARDRSRDHQRPK